MLTILSVIAVLLVLFLVGSLWEFVEKRVKGTKGEKVLEATEAVAETAENVSDKISDIFFYLRVFGFIATGIVCLVVFGAELLWPALAMIGLGIFLYFWEG